MKSLLRAAAIAVASTALVAGGASVATAAPAVGQTAPVSSTSASTASTAADVSIAVGPPYPLDYKSKIRIHKKGKKLTFRFTARYINDAGTPVGIRRAYLEVKKNHKWRTLKRVSLNSKGTATYRRSDGKKRNYRMVIRPTSVYQGGMTTSTEKI